MSKYRKGACYLRHMKPGDKGNDFRTAIRLGVFSDPSNWKHPERCKPVVMVQYGVKGVSAVWMNRKEAISSLLTHIQKRRRNTKYSKKRGQRMTKGDLRKVFRKWAFKHNENKGGVA